MANRTAENGFSGIRVIETFDSVGLGLGDQIAKLVDALNLGGKVSITAQNTPTAEDPTPQRVRVGGTPVQIDVFRGALNTYNQALQEGFSERALSTKMDDYFEKSRLERFK